MDELVLLGRAKSRSGSAGTVPPRKMTLIAWLLQEVVSSISQTAAAYRPMFCSFAPPSALGGSGESGLSVFGAPSNDPALARNHKFFYDMALEDYAAGSLDSWAGFTRLVSGRQAGFVEALFFLVHVQLPSTS